MEIKVLREVLEANQNQADVIRTQLRQKNILMINLIGSPGSGKTSLLERTIAYLRDRYRIGVIEGDVATDRDARRLQHFDIPIVLINTGGACHLESVSIQRALHEFEDKQLDFIFVENIGNLVCPAEFDIGENAKVAVSSVAEGHDKPEKYPLLFSECSAVVLNKADLAPFTDFDAQSYYASVKNLNGTAPVFELSCRTGEKLAPWYEWLIQRYAAWTGKKT